MKSIPIYLFLLFLVVPAWGQSVQELLDKAINDRENHKYEKASQTVEEALHKARISNDSLSIGSCYLQQGRISKDQNEIEQAIIAYQQAIPYFKNAEYLDRLAIVYSNISGVYEMDLQYEKSIYAAHKAIHLLSKDTFAYPNLIAKAYINASNSLESVEKIDSAILYSRRAISILEDEKTRKSTKTQYSSTLGDAYYGLANRLADNNKLKAALLASQKALGYYQDKKNLDKEAYAHEQLGTLYQEESKYPEAIKEYALAEQRYLQTEDSLGLNNVYYNLGLLYSLEKNYSEASSYYSKAINYIENSGDFQDLIQSQAEVTKAKINQSRWFSLFGIVAFLLTLLSLVMCRKWFSVQTKLAKERELALIEQERITQKEKETLAIQKDLIEQKKINIEQQQVLTEKEQKTLLTEKKLLETRQILVDQQQSLTEKEQKTLTTEKELLEARQILVNQQESLTEKEREILESQKELMEVKEEIDQVRHDVIKSNILAVQNHLEGAIPLTVEPILGDKLKVSLSIIKRLCNIVERPLFGLGQQSKLGDLVKYLHIIAESLSSMSVKLFDEIDDAVGYPVKAQVQTNIEAIIHIAFINIAKHAQCTETTLSFEVDERGLIFIIEDNGKGFDANTIREGAKGLKNIKVRVAKMYGQFHMETAPQQGTKLTIVVPSFVDDI